MEASSSSVPLSSALEAGTNLVPDGFLEEAASAAATAPRDVQSMSGLTTNTSAVALEIKDFDDFVEILRAELENIPVWPPEVRDPTGPLAWCGIRGIFPWDAMEEAPAPHIRRWTGQKPVQTLTTGRHRSLKEWVDEGGSLGFTSSSPEAAVATFFEWAATRPGIRDAIRSVEVDRPRDCTGLQYVFFLRCDLAHARDVDHVFPPRDFRRSFHGTCMEVLNRVLSKGLRTGWSVNRDGQRILRGIWPLSPECTRLITSYTLYSALDDSGYVYGPILEIRSPCYDVQQRPTAMRRSNNATQWLSYPDSTTMIYLWVNIIHVGELFKAPANAGAIFAESAFRRELEIDPEESWEELARRSHAAYAFSLSQ